MSHAPFVSTSPPQSPVAQFRSVSYAPFGSPSPPRSPSPPPYTLGSTSPYPSFTGMQPLGSPGASLPAPLPMRPGWLGQNMGLSVPNFMTPDLWRFCPDIPDQGPVLNGRHCISSKKSNSNLDSQKSVPGVQQEYSALPEPPGNSMKASANSMQHQVSQLSEDEAVELGNAIRRGMSAPHRSKTGSKRGGQQKSRPSDSQARMTNLFSCCPPKHEKTAPIPVVSSRERMEISDLDHLPPEAHRTLRRAASIGGAGHQVATHVAAARKALRKDNPDYHWCGSGSAGGSEYQ